MQNKQSYLKIIPVYLLCVLFLVATMSCNDSGGSSDSGSATLDASETITGFDNTDVTNSISKLNYFVLKTDTHSTTANIAMSYLGSDETFMTRYSAVYVLGGTGNATDHGVALLEVMNSDSDTRLQTMAAGILIGWGYSEAIPVLITSLSSSEYLPFTAEEPIWTLAQKALPNYTDQDLDLSTATTSTTVSATQTAWQSWWDTNGSSLTWSSSTKQYSN